MSNQDLTQQNLAGVFWPPESVSSFLRTVILVLAGTAFLALCAKIQIPMWPVPVSMATFAVLLIGALYGLKLGLATILAYLAEGAMGLPVFSGTPEKGIGLAYMMGPTGGYLLGFVIAVAVVGYFTDRGWDRSVFKMIPVMLLASIAIYIPGLIWLNSILGGDWEKTISLGIAPFLYGDALKLLLAASVAPLAWQFVSKLRR